MIERTFALIPILLYQVLLPSGIEVIHNRVSVEFPDSITFHLRASSDDVIEDVELEYGLSLPACGTDVNRVFVDDFRPSQEVETSWTWDMRQTGSLPPGASIWWRWHITDSSGNEIRTPEQWSRWIDDDHEWRSIETDGIELYWYEGDEGFARELIAKAEESRERLKSEVGIELARTVQIYVYADTEDMRDAILFEAGWTGAQAYPDHGVVIIGVSDAELDWGLDTIAHEFVHVVVGEVVSHCYSRLPTWLSEGLAMVAEGELSPGSQQILEEAIRDDELYSVRSLSDGFTEETSGAYLSYAQSYSLVQFLIHTYGQEKMLRLLDAFQDGYQDDHALQEVYGLNQEDLDALWRSSIGAEAKSESGRKLEPTPSVFPTIQPYEGFPVAATPTPAFYETPTPSHEGMEPLLLTLGTAAGCILLLFMVMTLAIVLLFHRSRESRGEDGTE